jgi:dephospho-CoA kinase
LTGGIGSGKSTVAARLAQHGAWVIDSDRIAREVVEPGSPGLRAVVDAFGARLLTASGALDRAALAAHVFTDAAARRRLDAIVHPRVAARSADLIEAAPDDAIVVQDIPLLVEAGLAASFPLVVVIHADRAERIRRLVEQRAMPAADVRARIAAQATDEQRRDAADVWLDNNGGRDRTIAAVDQLWDQRLVPFEGNLRHRRPAPRPVHPALVTPDGSWPRQAQRLIDRIAAVGGARARRIDHIGSTSIPGLAAKDVLDVQIVVADLDVARRLTGDLIDAGLVRRHGRWTDVVRDGIGRDKEMVTNADPARMVNCHVRPADSAAWRDALLLRDWLRAHPQAAGEYAELTYRLVARQRDSTDACAAATTPFVHRALDRAESWAVRTGWRVN